MSNEKPSPGASRAPADASTDPTGDAAGTIRSRRPGLVGFMGGVSLRARLGFAGASVLLIAAGILVIDRQRSWQRTIAPVRHAMIHAADGFRYPGVPPPVPPPPSGRSPGAVSPELRQSIADLRARFDEDEESLEVAFWLGGALVAAGELETARALIDIARVKHPREPGIWNLDGILAAKEGNLEEARQIFGTLLDYHPGNEAAEANLETITGNRPPRAISP